MNGKLTEDNKRYVEKLDRETYLAEYLKKGDSWLGSHISGCVQPIRNLSDRIIKV